MQQQDHTQKTETLVIISPGFAADEADTTCLPSVESAILTLNRIYPKLNIVILSLHYPYHSNPYTWHHHLVHPLNGGNKVALRGILWIKALKRLHGISKEKNVIGILSLWCLEAALIGKCFSTWKKLKHRIWIRGQDAQKQNYFVRWIKPSPEDLIALSPFLRETFAKNHSILPEHTICNGINPDLFADSHPDRTIDILGVGSLIPLKHYDRFLEIVQKLYKAKSDLRVELVGSGPEEQSLREQIRILGLERIVLMRNALPHSEVMTIMRQSKILLHPSRYEGYSTVAIEALFCGCHVVSYTSAEEKEIDHWHVVHSENEMTGKCLSLLERNSDFSPVLVHDLRIEIVKLMQLFDYPQATS